MKRIISILLLVSLGTAMCLCLVGCGELTLEDAIGVWKRKESTFSEKWNCLTDFYIKLDNKGGAFEVTVDSREGKLLNYFISSWTLKYDEKEERNEVAIRAGKDIGAGNAYYHKDGSCLVNGDHEYEKLSELPSDIEAYFKYIEG
jgi:hypothetical protein